MAMRIGGIPVLLSPADVADGIRAVLGWTDDAVELLADLPGRVDRLLTEAEALLTQMRVLAERVDRVATTAETVTAAAGEVVTAATTVTTAAQHAVAEAAGVLTVYQPIADRAAPLVRQFVDEFSTEELHAAIRMVDTIPRLAAHVETDVLPLLATLDHVGPDLRQLISLVTDMRNALSMVPGLRLLLPRPEEK